MNIENALEGWVSPVELIYKDYQDTILEQTDEYIVARCEAALGVKVDRNELIKAMNYDREQYKKGFENGYKKRDDKIVRCIDCKHYKSENSSCYRRCSIDKGGYILPVMPLDFCSRGERKETNECT